MSEPDVEIRRVYGESAAGAAGRGEHRILVDRLWPRGIAKADATWEEWAKDVAPSTELRRWYGHDVERWDEFVTRYRAELAEAPASDALAHLEELAAAGKLVLLTATKDVEHSAAWVLEHTIADKGTKR
ncbi:MAG: DUF488 family protein [Acidimicrobiia bacterium]